MKTLKFLVFAALALGLCAACSEDEAPKNEVPEFDIPQTELDDWALVMPVTPTDNQKSRLEEAFSGSSELLRNSRGDTLVVINNQQEMRALQPSDKDVGVDWETQCVVGGKIVTPSISDRVLSGQLLEHLETGLCRYEIEVERCTVCYAAIGVHYFWAIYNKKLEAKKVSLMVKTAEEEVI
jgi:hypothetical protein